MLLDNKSITSALRSSVVEQQINFCHVVGSIPA